MRSFVDLDQDEERKSARVFWRFFFLSFCVLLANIVQAIAADVLAGHCATIAGNRFGIFVAIADEEIEAVVTVRRIVARHAALAAGRRLDVGRRHDGLRVDDRTINLEKS